MIHELLMIGMENARTAAELATVANVSPRHLQVMIELERRSGHPICASSDPRNPGFYLAADDDELNGYVQRLKHRESEIRRTRRALQRQVKT